MGELGLGLGTVGRNEESLTVHEAELAMLKRWEKQGVFYPVKSLLRVKVLTTLRRCVELNDQGILYTCKMIPRSVFADTCPGTLLTEWNEAETGEPARQDKLLARRGAGRARGGRG